MFAATLTPATPAGARDTTAQIPDAADAPIALLVDADSGQVLFSRNPDRRFMPASMTKVMTLYTGFRLVKEGKLSLSRHIPYREDAYHEWYHKGSSLFLPHGADPSVDLLLRGIAAVSANDGAVVLAEGVGGSVAGWTKMMNANARRLGMHDSHFHTPNGWPDEGGTFVSAHDLVVLGRAIVQNYPVFFHRYIGQPGLTAYGITQENHDPLSGKVPGADGIKTGFTNQAGYGFLGTAKRDGRRLMLVIATAPTWRQRNRSARELLEWGYSHFSDYRAFPAGATIAKAQVQDGNARFVPLVAPDGVRLSVPTGSTAPVKLEVAYDGPLHAPIQKGAPIARLRITAPGIAPSSIPLVAGKAVARAGPIRRVLNSLAAWWR